MSYLLFVSRPTGYELREREGDPPSIGDLVEEEDGRMTIGAGENGGTAVRVVLPSYAAEIGS